MTQRIGKRVGMALYIHETAIVSLAGDQRLLATNAQNLAAELNWNVLKINVVGGTVSLLNYPEFFEQACPALEHSLHIDVENRSKSFRSYADSINPPVLHRKELLLPTDHPRHGEFRSLTEMLDQLGLLDANRPIGFQRDWETWLAENGFRIRDHALEPIGNAEIEVLPEAAAGPILRHKTALDRNALSAPMKLLERYNYLDGRYTFFDYGCGKGGDVERLAAQNISVGGWDPYFANDEDVQPADVVNLGFVINVIEDRAERDEALQIAFSLAREFLIVSVMLTNQKRAAAQAFSDGTRSSASTFQKYYTQDELRAYLQEALGEEPLAIAPGICLVFKHADAKLQFLGRRIRGRTRASIKTGAPHRVTRKRQGRQLNDEQKLALDAYWAEALELGYMGPPSPACLNGIVEQFGTVRRAQNQVSKQFDQSLLSGAANQRRNELLVLLAINRLRVTAARKGLELDQLAAIEALFGTFRRAWLGAEALVEALGDLERLEEDCSDAAALGLGQYCGIASFIFHREILDRLPALLQLQVWLAALLSDGIEQFDLIKLHIPKNKVSLFSHARFSEARLPKLELQQIIDLKSLRVFNRTPAQTELLLFKADYLSEETTGYASQLEFDNLFSRVTPRTHRLHLPFADVQSALAASHWEVSHGRMVRPTTYPSLDEPCGANLTFRDLIECGSTRERLGLQNLPRNPASYWALEDLALAVLDPLIDYYGAIDLTYGFCSPELSRAIKKHIAPKLDQHCAYETNRAGNSICARGGAAVDFIVHDEDMREVAEWIFDHLEFDRLYFYGFNRPIHVSYGPECAGMAYEITTSTAGKRYPKPFWRQD